MSKKEIMKILIAMGEYFERSLTETQLSMYTSDLEDLSPDQVMFAFAEYRRNPKNTRFPLPSAIRTILEPESDDQTTAVDLAGKIATAIEQKGYVWAWDGGHRGYRTFGDAVIAELGSLALTVIERFGGWKSIHDAYFEMDRGMFNAVLRERISATIRLAKANRLNHRPMIPFQQERHVISERAGPKSIGQILERSFKKEKENGNDK
jgi:hypothetical protein